MNSISLLDETLNQQVDSSGDHVYAAGYEHNMFEFLTITFAYGEDFHGCKVVIDVLLHSGVGPFPTCLT